MTSQPSIAAITPISRRGPKTSTATAGPQRADPRRCGGRILGGDFQPDLPSARVRPGGDQVDAGGGEGGFVGDDPVGHGLELAERARREFHVDVGAGAAAQPSPERRRVPREGDDADVPGGADAGATHSATSQRRRPPDPCDSSLMPRKVASPPCRSDGVGRRLLRRLASPVPGTTGLCLNPDAACDHRCDARAKFRRTSGLLEELVTGNCRDALQGRGRTRV